MRSNSNKKHSLKNSKVDVVMKRIREQAKKAIASSDIAPRPIPIGSRQAKREDNKQSVLYSEELNYLNANWHNWNPATEITSHRPIIGRFIVRIKRFFVDLVWNYLLKAYFERERLFHMNLVKYLNANARYIDSRNADLFWQLIQKIDHDVQSINERVDHLFDHAEARMQAIEEDFSKTIEDLDHVRFMVSNASSRTKKELLELEEYGHELESKISQLKLARGRSGGRGLSSSQTSVVSVSGEPIPDPFFVVGARAAGSESAVKEHLNDLVEYFSDTQGLVVDFGCERGEFLELLASRGIQAVGLSFSEELAELCKDKGLRVEQTENVKWLGEVEDRSLGGVFTKNATNILNPAQLGLFFELVAQKVQVGGRLVIEVGNPQPLVGFSKSLANIPHHRESYQADVLRMIVEAYGMRILDIAPRQSSKVKQRGGELELIKFDESLPPRWHNALKPINDNIKRLNEMLFTYKSYVLVAEIQE